MRGRNLLRTGREKDRASTCPSPTAWLLPPKRAAARRGLLSPNAEEEALGERRVRHRTQISSLFLALGRTFDQSGHIGLVALFRLQEGIVRRLVVGDLGFLAFNLS